MNYRPLQDGTLMIGESSARYSVVCCPNGWLPVTGGCQDREKGLVSIIREFSSLSPLKESEKLQFIKAILDF